MSETMKRVLLVEDDRKISDITKLYLQHHGFDVTCAYTAGIAQAELKRSAFSFVVFDVMLPDGDGYQLLQQLREGVYFLSDSSTPPDTPAMMLTALDQTEQVVKGLTAGADDYLSKPFEPAVFVARIGAILKRTSQSRQESSMFRVADLQFALTARTVTCRDVALSLNRREYDLLLFFCRNPRKVYHREQLIAQIWDSEFDGSDRSVDVCVQRVRSKLKKHKAGVQIATVWGIGYMMEETTS